MYVFVSPTFLPPYPQINLPMTTPSQTHISWYLFHFHPFPGFCPNLMDRTDYSINSAFILCKICYKDVAAKEVTKIALHCDYDAHEQFQIIKNSYRHTTELFMSFPFSQTVSRYFNTPPSFCVFSYFLGCSCSFSAWYYAKSFIVECCHTAGIVGQKVKHITPLLRKLHWLRVPERIKFQLCVLAFRCLHGTAPRYLADTLHLTTSRSSCSRLQSAVTSTLIVPATRRWTLGDCAFPAAAARAWNSLPSFVIDEHSLAVFWQQDSRLLFRTSFGENANYLSHVTVNT